MASTQPAAAITEPLPPESPTQESVRSAPSGPERGGSVRYVLSATGAYLLIWVVFLAFENLAIGLGYRRYFAGPWEMTLARTYAAPLFFGMLLPAALGAAIFARVAARLARTSMRRALTGLTCVFSIAVGLGVTQGRHFEALPNRVGFVAVLALTTTALIYALCMRLLTMIEAHPSATAWGSLVLMPLAWVADAFVLPRLYPAFHTGLLILTLLLAGFARDVAKRVPRLILALPVVVSVFALVLVRPLARGLAPADNLRLVLIDHAPWMGRATALAARVVPAVVSEDVDSLATNPAKIDAARSLDWSGRDILLITVDALRADHIGAYGYGKPTTPAIDKLAGEGVRFEYAYCATPHTSYSVTSLMTGKYMRPLLMMGAGSDSDTFASVLRTYEYRTAAFYPPAVFFIDAARFEGFDRTHLGFEYAKVEFAKPELREAQIQAYLDGATTTKPLFLWLHLFEPHEPYEWHEAHPFGTREAHTDIEAYDSEVAEADAAIGRIVTLFEAKRHAPVVIVSADHGEEFGEHGGRYHGTTVYEEQVRVPLIVRAPGLHAHVAREPVQTVDVLPTVLSALGIPRPPRIRGRDLGIALADKPAAPNAPATHDHGFAFVETDAMTLLAEGPLRLVCRKAEGACTLYDVVHDPQQLHDLSAERTDVARHLRALTKATEKEHGRFEGAVGANLPDALRRAMSGERDAAPEVAELLEDVRPDLRILAAKTLLSLRSSQVLAQLERAQKTEKDADVKPWIGVALARIRRIKMPDIGASEGLASIDVGWLTSPTPQVRVAAALAYAEYNDARGEDVLVNEWTHTQGRRELEPSEELLSAFTTLKSRAAVPGLIQTLDDVRLRPRIAETLGVIGDARAKSPLLDAFAREHYIPMREPEALALLRLGAKEELRAPLAFYAGGPEPFDTILSVAAHAGLLHSAPNAAEGKGALSLRAVVTAKEQGPLRIVVGTRPAGPAETIRGALPKLTVANRPIILEAHGSLSVGLMPEELRDQLAKGVPIELLSERAIDGVWIVPVTQEREPEPKIAGDAGAP